MKEYKIATIAGDGIGKEVLPEGVKILKEIAKQHQSFLLNYATRLHRPSGFSDAANLQIFFVKDASELQHNSV